MTLQQLNPLKFFSDNPIERRGAIRAIVFIFFLLNVITELFGSAKETTLIISSLSATTFLVGLFIMDYIDTYFDRKDNDEKQNQF